MKKLALTSLLAFMAVSGAHAANVIDGNPLYMPRAGHFYSVTDLSSHSEDTDLWTLGEEFGYGISDKLGINLKTSFVEREGFDDYAWQDLALKATFRAFADGNVVADVYGAYAAGPIVPLGGGLVAHSKVADDTFWFDKDLINYTWTAGVRMGYTTGALTLAGHFEYDYINTESFNWNEEGAGWTNHAMKFGLDGQYVIDQSWNLVAGAEYKGYLDDEADNSGTWTGYFGVNYNIDATKFVGAYINGSMNHHGGTNADEWETEDGFGFGAKFGIDF